MVHLARQAHRLSQVTGCNEKDVDMLDAHAPLVRSLSSDPAVTRAKLEGRGVSARFAELERTISGSLDDAAMIRGRCALGLVFASVLGPPRPEPDRDGCGTGRRLTEPEKKFVAAAALAVPALAAAPPVGPLPSGPTSTISTQKGQLVAVALPHRPGGRVWRIARAFDGNVLKEVTEGDLGAQVVIVFKAAGTGTTAVVFALTRGERAKAYEARRFTVHVS